MAPRGRGGKFSKPSRGGGKHFSRDLQPLDKDGNQMGLWREPGEQIKSSGDEDSSSEEESSEESSEDESKPEPSTTEGTREERRAAAKAKKAAALKKRGQGPAQPGDLPPSESEESDNELPANPNHTAKSRSQTLKAVGTEPTAEPKKPAKVKDISQLSRREREAVQAQQARERYQKLHAEGKTDEAKADLARLAIIREQREAERQRKLAEKEEKDEQAKERADAAQEREDRMRAAALGKGSKKVGGKKK
ncbi:hypothetical protein N7491_010112 [Penicillium cf. griseofulvum]|uniref:Casein kinase substrate phosphoprotein PP28 domain-containing protein n=1 Tax=Penicillium cf. griseofulvum TaxID=2972120 RepID=A0A9W9T5R9_9EURO|nr:hypothetical protein N7472_000445 [Penicillium cf. griseofulvum]KAJ5421667.1 hypothetical protein N7491_010112 [Penicillium cf. griseofulvum]KAJ5424908.1 hypothetical protein N7445_010881 [Penicillium cf. griseofulvum]